MTFANTQCVSISATGPQFQVEPAMMSRGKEGVRDAEPSEQAGSASVEASASFDSEMND